MILSSDQRISELIRESAYPLILLPKDPKTDSVAGALALFLILKKMKKSARIVCAESHDSSDTEDRISEKFSFLPAVEAIQSDISRDRLYKISFDIGKNKISELSYDQGGGFLNIYITAETDVITEKAVKMEALKFKHDLLLAISGENAESFGRVYFKNQDLFSAIPAVSIGSGIFGEGFGAADSAKPARLFVSETVAEICREILPEGMDEKIAALLLSGIIDETDNFQSPNIKPAIFRLAADFMIAGADRDEIAKHFRRIKTRPREIGGVSDSAKQRIFFGFASLGALAGLLFLKSPDFFSSQKPFAEAEPFLKPEFEESGLSNFLRSKADASFFQPADSASRPPADGFERSQEEALPSATIAIKPDSAIGSPVLLDIPFLKINAKIQFAGLDKNGAMEAPNNFKDAAWFGLGFKPGEQGNAVIAGHLDSDRGADGVFRDLHKLNAGDYIYITDDQNQKFRFVVIAKRAYDEKAAPMEEIFGSSDKPRLNLITCDGVWDRGKSDYSKRMVVFSELAPEPR